MAENSGISWTHHTWNPWMGCHKVSAECKNCYIDATIRRMAKPSFDGPFRAKSTWRTPYKWQRNAAERKRVFTCSLSDFFHEDADDWRDDAWRVIRECDQLDWLILTKRPDRIAECLPNDWHDGYANVWLGVTVGVRASLWRIDELSKTPAAVRFISAEPLLESIDFTPYQDSIDWLILGGESGPNRRPSDVAWYIEAAEQFARKPVWMKQDTAFRSGQQGNIPDALWSRKELPTNFKNRVER